MGKTLAALQKNLPCRVEVFYLPLRNICRKQLNLVVCYRTTVKASHTLGEKVINKLIHNYNKSAAKKRHVEKEYLDMVDFFFLFKINSNFWDYFICNVFHIWRRNICVNCSFQLSQNSFINLIFLNTS